jgi:hypothetical protein
VCMRARVYVCVVCVFAGAGVGAKWQDGAQLPDVRLSPPFPISMGCNPAWAVRAAAAVEVASAVEVAAAAAVAV